MVRWTNFKWISSLSFLKKKALQKWNTKSHAIYTLSLYSVCTKDSKRGIWSLFDPCVNTVGRRPYCLSRMEESYCTFGFSAIIRRDLRTLSLPRDSMHVCDPRGKGNSHLTKLFGGLSYEKIRRYNNSPPYVTARWLPQQILLKFPWSAQYSVHSVAILELKEGVGD